jgi:5S rRNA maturation endonuclease (ribonuclease M5)
VGFPGIDAKLKEEHFNALREKHVYILFDWDNPGNRRAEALQKELELWGISSTRKIISDPNIKDMNDFLVRKNKTNKEVV